MKLGLKMVLVMVGMALGSAALLGLIYGVTTPVIAENNERARQAALGSLIPAADRFEPDTIIEGADTTVIYHAYNDTMGMKVGMVFNVAPKGYAGPIKIMVGVNMDSTIAAIRIAGAAEGMKETPGLGAKVLEEWFVNQFKGLITEELYLAKAKDGGQVDGITAATVSSDAVTAGIRDGMNRFLPYLKNTPRTEGTSIETDQMEGEEGDAESTGETQTQPELAPRTVTADGWGGEFLVVVFFDGQGRIAKIDIPVQGFNETTGYGSLCCEPGFTAKFAGLGSSEEVMAVDVISGATVTSNAIKNAVAGAF